MCVCVCVCVCDVCVCACACNELTGNRREVPDKRAGVTVSDSHMIYGGARPDGAFGR